ncbi:MAG: hypothetical protein ACKVS7_12770 [Gemmatimonadaceae bacterium]
MSMARVARASWTGLAVMLGLLPASAGVSAQPVVSSAANAAATCLRDLHGRWVGPGTVLGRAITMEQDWSPALGGSFTELRMRHYAPDSTARVTFEGRGLYRAGGDTVSGTWSDLRGVTFDIAGRCAGGAFTSEWRGVERGQTTYALRADTMVVIDSVWPANGSAKREFGRSVLRRDVVRAADESAARALADSALAMITRLDFVALTDLMLDEGVTFSARERAGEIRYNARTRAQERESQVAGTLSERGFDAQVRVSGPLATVWVPYDLYLNGQWSHCGVDAFTLLKIDGRWRIATLVWSVEQPPACLRHPGGAPRP